MFESTMFDRRRFLGLGSSALGYAALGSPSAGAAGTLRYPGVNLAGGEFGTGNQLNHDYIYPSEKQVAYYASRGFKMLRVPIKSHRLVVGGRANLVDIGLLKTVVDAAAAHNMRVLIDMHEYALRPDGNPMNDWD